MFKDIKRDLKSLKINSRTLFNFGLLFFVVLCLLSLFFYFKGKSFWFWPLPFAVLFLFLGWALPNALRGFYRVWMCFAFCLGWLVARFILVLTFFLIFTPIALILKISGKDLLKQKIDKGALSYWEKCEKITDKSQYTKQF